MKKCPERKKAIIATYIQLIAQFVTAFTVMINVLLLFIIIENHDSNHDIVTEIYD